MSMMPEQEALLRKARNSVAVARLVADNGYYDEAVSRAYYAMFYVAEALLLGEGLAFSKHAGVIGAFGKELAKTGRVSVEFHRYLIDAQKARTSADYDLTGASATAQEAAMQITRAEEFLQLAEQLIGPLPSAEDEEAE